MFILSKLFWIIFQPLAFIFLCVVASLLLILMGQPVPAALMAGLACLLLFVMLFTNSGAVLIANLERRFNRKDTETPPACAIVLGGGINTRLSAQRGTYVFTRAADRYIEALRLARVYPDMRILITGGDNALSGNIHGEAEPATRFFIDHGVAPERLICEPQARNTAENAANTADILKQEKIETPWLLITSAYHMPRAIALFEKQNIAVIPWPADFRTEADIRWHISLDRPVANATMFSTALREWSGLVVYRLTGKTDKLTPGPAPERTKQMTR